MALTRLRNILGCEHLVRVESSAKLITRVNKNIQKRAQKFTAKGQTAPITKANPTVVAEVQAKPNWSIRAIDLLHKIGDLTTPVGVKSNLARLSASWATRRYCWAISEGNGGTPPFRLSTDAREMDFHQKTLLSDEFGIGMAGLLLEEYCEAGSFVDVSIALDDPNLYQGVTQVETAQPDYLMWGESAGTPY